MFVFSTLLDNDEEICLIERLYNNYERMMFHYALKYLRNKTDAEDAVSETFLRTIKNISKILNSDDLQIKGYLFVTLKNITIDIINERKKFSEKILPEYEETETEDVEIAYFSKLNLECLKAAFDMLPEQYRSILLFNVKYEMGISEIASSLGLTYSAAQKKLCRAKKRFKELIEEYDYGK